MYKSVRKLKRVTSAKKDKELTEQYEQRRREDEKLSPEERKKRAEEAKKELFE